MTKNFFDMKTKVALGENSMSNLAVYNSRKIFLVIDPFLDGTPLLAGILEHLAAAKVEIFKDIVPDPPVEMVVSALERLVEFKADVIIAVGGGSAIDGAKAMMFFAVTSGKLPKMDFVAIPTTSGTGSEVTSFAVITDKTAGKKYPLVNDLMLPTLAILDSDLVLSVPKKIVANTGIDVLTHAIEAKVSLNSNPFADALAEKAIKLVFENLKLSYDYKVGDFKVVGSTAREKMHFASTMAGMAFNSTNLGLNHSIAHILGGKFKIPHGRANGVLLPYVIEFNADVSGFNNGSYGIAAQKYAEIAEILGLKGATVKASVSNLVKAIGRLQRQLNLPMTLKDCGVDGDDFNNLKFEIAQLALEDGCIATNPRAVAVEDVVGILEDAYGGA